MPWPVRAAGVLILLGGVSLAATGYAALGGSHSPGTTPTSGARLVSSGIYARLRHPVYAGWCLAALGLALILGSLLGVGVAIAAVVYYDLRTREEDRLLLKRYPDYDAYRRRVKRFVPRVY